MTRERGLGQRGSGGRPPGQQRGQGSSPGPAPAVGGGLHAKTIQMLVNILDFGMDPQASADAPAFIGWGAGLVEADSFDQKVLDGLKEFGLAPEIASDQARHRARARPSSSRLAFRAD